MVSYFSLWSMCAAVLVMISSTTWAASPTSENIDNNLGYIISRSYDHFAKSASNANQLNEIQLKAEQYFSNEKYAEALKTLATNNALNAKYFSDPKMQSTIRLALQLHSQVIVEELLAQANQQANVGVEGIITFELSRFYADLENWDKVIHLLSDDSLFEQLSLADRAEANVLLGTALQKQKKHREAMKLYERVSEDSDYFRIAQLNLATSYLRQEWWTDAFSSINNALKVNIKKRDALDYRLYTVLGYAQIQFGFYRDARESFRNIAISSEYANRALLGLGIAALHQQDFIGALNAFDTLRTKAQPDISVAEAHLLSAFTLRQLEQYDAATSRYQEAINYYQKISSDIAIKLSSAEPVSLTFLHKQYSTDKILINNDKKLSLLNSLEKMNVDHNGSSATNNLRSKINRESAQRAAKLLQEEKDTIDSYLSQSRFGLASLYDHK